MGLVQDAYSATKPVMPSEGNVSARRGRPRTPIRLAPFCEPNHFPLSRPHYTRQHEACTTCDAVAGLSQSGQNFTQYKFVALLSAPAPLARPTAPLHPVP